MSSSRASLRTEGDAWTPPKSAVAGLAPEASARVLQVLGRFHLPLILPETITTEIVMEKLATDKKFSAGAIRFVVLDAPGSAKVINDVTAADLREAIEHLRS